LSKLGNIIHIKSQNFVIRNLLLFKKNTPFDTLIVKESERLIRSQRFVRRVAITSQLTNVESDSVDVFVTVLDAWSIVPNASITTSKASYQLKERNLLGFGHEWNHKFNQNLEDKKQSYSTKYVIPNFKNTYIRTSVNYQIDIDKDFIKNISIERPFFSPLTHLAGGILFEKQLQKDSLVNNLDVFKIQQIKTDKKDFWLGYSFKISNPENAKKDLTNFISTIRYYKENYLEKPEQEFDIDNYYTSESFGLISFGISSRKYVQDKYIYNYNIIEDVPIGKYFGTTMGYQNKNNVNRFYFGLRATLGNYFKWGYFATNHELGSFYKNNRSEQSAYSAQISYFTPLFEPGEWKIRQFFKSTFINGVRRLNSIGDQLNINNSNGIQGFNDPKLFGTKKFVLALQTQTYSPWDISGFRFSPFLNYSLAMLGNSQSGFKKSQGFSKIGLGIIITNDYLVFNSFQISIAYYPKISNEGINIFKTNSFSTEDFGYLDFEINKPRTVLYE